MYLTRITLSPTAYRARNLLANTQTLHAALAASFPVSSERHKDGSPVERILWRLDYRAGMAEPILFVASPNGPDLDEAQERITTGDRIVTKDYQPLLDRLTAGDVYSFRLAANPTRYERRDAKTETPSGHLVTHGRVPLHRHDEQIAWLVGKFATAGAELLPVAGTQRVLDVVVTGEKSDNFTRRGSSSNGTRGSSPGRNGVTIKRVGYTGHLTVTDPAPFRTALVAGIGPAKGYGCGLLTLAPPVQHH